MIGIGVILPPVAVQRDQHLDLATAARHAEECGLAGVWHGDHLMTGRPALDCTIALAVAAAATSRIRIGTGVFVPALRPLAWAAKQIASLQHVSGGRLVLGVGSGGGADQFAAAGEPYAERGARTDTALELLPRLLRGESVDLPGATAVLAPAVEPPPIWVGNASEMALRRAARFGDGWFPVAGAGGGAGARRRPAARAGVPVRPRRTGRGHRRHRGHRAGRAGAPRPRRRHRSGRTAGRSRRSPTCRSRGRHSRSPSSWPPTRTPARHMRSSASRAVTGGSSASCWPGPRGRDRHVGARAAGPSRKRARTAITAGSCVTEAAANGRSTRTPVRSGRMERLRGEETGAAMVAVTGWRRRGGEGAVAGLAAGRRISRELRGGLDGPGVGAAARELRLLLGAQGVGLSGLHGAAEWSGRPADGADALVERVLRSDARASSGELTALPVHSRDELAGVLVVAGDVPTAAAREAAAWVGEALDVAQLEESAAAAVQAELRALRAEISPHFVYNSLTVIASFVRSDPERARELMLDFAAYTRHSLARHGEYTTVAGEFAAIEAYLALARAVLGERLRVQVRIAPEILPVALPYLALQPLVENAVRHGVELGTGGLVQVSGEAQGAECVISVEDDGPGMEPGYAADVLAGRAGGLGLSNVDRRLRTVFGPGYGLVVETAPDAGTRVALRVPRFQPGVSAV